MFLNSSIGISEGVRATLFLRDCRKRNIIHRGGVDIKINGMAQFCFVLASHIHLDKFDVYLKRILLFVLFLYMILYPHSRQRIGSRDLISFSVWHSKRKQKHGNDTKSINKHIAFHNTSHYTHHGFGTQFNAWHGFLFSNLQCGLSK